MVEHGISLDNLGNSRSSTSNLDVIIVDESVLLKKEFERAKSVTINDFPDRTGFECFVNHVHMPYDGSRTSLLASLQYAKNLQSRLAALDQGRTFLVIVSISDDNCVVRFHQCRKGEQWLADDLEGYAEEAVLVLPAGATPSSDH